MRSAELLLAELLLLLGSRYPLRAIETGRNAPEHWHRSASAQVQWLHSQQIRVGGSRFFIHGGSGGFSDGSRFALSRRIALRACRY
jgi:hypothetical protein